MFKSLGNIASLLKQAQAMKSKMGELQDKLARVRVEGSAGGGMVTVEVNGQQKVTGIRIDEQLLGTQDDREMLEDLLVAACNQALDKAKEAAAQEMAELTGGIGLPGMEDVLKELQTGDDPPRP
jgi:nucleoid-associated protein EbfC